jgi:heterotetrameric sarcosine oxidase gamma subunit
MGRKVSAIDAWARTRGAQFTEAGGWRVVEAFSAVQAEVVAARDQVALADVSAMGKVQVEGEGAAEVLRAAMGGAPEGVGQGWRTQAGEAYSIRPDLFLVLTPPGGEDEALRRLEAARVGAAGLVTMTDMTHGLAAVSVIGPRCRDVLRKLCALDVSGAAFPNETARATSVAKTRQVIARRDVGEALAFTLVGARSLAAYVWEVLAEAGKEFGIMPIGMAGLEKLKSP